MSWGTSCWLRGVSLSLPLFCGVGTRIQVHSAKLCRYGSRYVARENVSLEKVVCFSKSICIVLQSPNVNAVVNMDNYFVHNFSASQC